MHHRGIFVRRHALMFSWLSCLVVGFVIFIARSNWVKISWRFSSAEKIDNHLDEIAAMLKDISLRYWKDDDFHSHKMTLVWQQHEAKNIKHVINTLLLHLYEERIIDYKVLLESVALNQIGNEAYLSFNHSFLSPHWSTRKKYRCIESFGKTIQEAFPNIKAIFFLVKRPERSYTYELMEDDHLDFSVGWPVSGFADVRDSCK